MQYKKGDKVRVKRFKRRPEHWNEYGKMDYLMGKVVEVKDSCGDVIYIDGDGFNDLWTLKNEDVEPVKNECIVIYRKDNQVIALDKVTGEKSVAKCSPEDEFDFYTGAKLAFERLTGKKSEEVKKLLNAKICVTKNLGNQFTKGKIYTIEDGKIMDNNMDVWPLRHSLHNMEEVRDYFSRFEDWKHVFPVHFEFRELKFVEVVE